MTEAQPRGFLSQVFISPYEPRLRAGWRLLIHTGLVIVFGLGLIIPLTFGLLLLNGMDLEALQNTLGGFAGNVMNIVVEVIVITAATWIARRFLDRRSFTSLGLQLNRSAFTDILFGILLGGLLMGLIFIVELLIGWLDFEQFAWTAAPMSTVIIQVVLWFLFWIGVGYAEELLSRGYHLQNLWAGLNLPLALVISSAVFAVLHASNPGASWVSTLGIFFAGFFLAYGYIRTGQLWIPIGLHIGWNFFQGTIFGFQVSGTEGFNLIQHTVNGPEMVTGGAFGPEAGLLGWAAIALGSALIWLYTRNRPAAVDPKTLRPVLTPPPDPAVQQ